jgi:hypothetical protein
MKRKNYKIEELEEGIQRDVMVYILHQVKDTKGLTHLLDNLGGLNGKWTSPRKAYNLSVDQFLKVVILKIYHQPLPELQSDLNNFTLWIKNYIQEHPKALEMMKKSPATKVPIKNKSKQDLIDFQ